MVNFMPRVIEAIGETYETHGRTFPKEVLCEKLACKLGILSGRIMREKLEFLVEIGYIEHQEGYPDITLTEKVIEKMKAGTRPDEK